MPYKPVTLDTRQATLVTHVAETNDGVTTGAHTVPSTDWAWASCSTTNPFPGTPDPSQICLKNGFDAGLLYQIVFTAQDPPVLGIGFAAFRDIGSFFKYAEADDMGTPNPIANNVTHAISRGVSQSGNYIRQFLHQGFNEDEAGRKVHDGAWPIVAGRRIALNFRFAMPDGVLKLFEPGIEGTQPWGPSADPVRGIPTAGILDRCAASDTCPKVLEHFGAAEMWGMKVSPAFVGTAADKDIPLPDDVRRYYIGSTRHGGGPGGFSTELMPAPACPSVGWGVGSLANNPLPHTETVNALRVHFRQWVMNDTLPPPSAYPTLASGQLVDPDKVSLGFPTIPGLPAHAPTGFINPMIDYDYGDGFNHSDGTGVMSNLPPVIKGVIPMKAPKVDADGNELGGVPVVQLEAPLGTYLGWNITAEGFFEGQPCNYAGGFVPFAKTQAERVENGDPRLSLEERYGDHAGYVNAVREAIARVADTGFLLGQDAERLIRQAEASDVLR